MAGNQPIDVDADLAGEHTKRVSEIAKGRRAVELPRGTSYFEIKARDKFQFDIIPFIKVDGHASTYQRIKLHRYIGVDPKDYLCLSMQGKPCPICNYYAKVKDDKTMDPRTLGNLKGKERFLYNVIDCNIKGDAPIQVLDMPPSRFDKQLHQAIDDSDDPERNKHFASLTKGLTLRVVFRPTDFGANDLEVSSLSFLPRRTSYDREIFNEVVPFDTILTFATAEEMIAALAGTDGGAAVNADVEAPAPARRTRHAALAAEPAAATDLPQASPGDEEAPAPAPRRRAPVQEAPTAEEAAPAPRRRAAPVAEAAPAEEVAPAPRRRAAPAQEEAQVDTPAPAPRRATQAMEEAQVDVQPRRRAAPPVEEAPAPAPRQAAPAAAAPAAFKCPHGFRYGIDGLEFAECDTCKVNNGDVSAWQQCLASSRKAKRAGTQA